MQSPRRARHTAFESGNNGLQGVTREIDGRCFAHIVHGLCLELSFIHFHYSARICTFHAMNILIRAAHSGNRPR